MNIYGKSILCTATLFMMVSSLARGADPDSASCAVSNQQVETPAATAPACDATPSCAAAGLPVFVPNLTPGFTFSAGFLLLRPGADNLGWSTVTTFLPIQSPQWAVQAFDPSYQPGFSVGVQYVFPCSGKDIQMYWEDLRTHDSAFKAVSDPATQWISPFNQTGPSTSEDTNTVGVFHLKSAEAQVDFDYDRLNIDVGQTVNIGSTQLRLFTGLSCVWLQEQILSTFYNNPNIDPVPPVIAVPNPLLKYINFNNTSTYSGLGPHLGVGTVCNLPYGFTFVSQLSGAILAGWMQPAQYSFTGVFDDAVDKEQISSDHVSQIVYASDAKLGVNYSCPLRNGSVLGIESGYRAAVFINPFSTYETSTNVLPLDIGSLSTNSMRHTPSNFTLSGFYANCSLQW